MENQPNETLETPEREKARELIKKIESTSITVYEELKPAKGNLDVAREAFLKDPETPPPFEYLIDEEKINRNLAPEDREMYDSLIEEIGEIKEGGPEPFEPSPETVKKFSGQINLLFENFFRHIPEDKEEFTPREAAGIVEEIVETEFSDEPVSDTKEITEFKVVVTGSGDACSVDQKAREIKFPETRAKGNFTREGLKKIIVHEFGVHAFRSMITEGDELRAFAQGMPGNEEIDEGIAKCCEQAVAGKFSVSGSGHYINIGLANLKGKNFREVFDIQQKLHYLKGCKKGRVETPEEKEARLHADDKRIFSNTQRCFRGTGELPNNKDLVYYNGADKIWRYIEAHIDDPDFPDQLFLSGKIDVTNEAQARLSYEKRVSAPKS